MCCRIFQYIDVEEGQFAASSCCYVMLMWNINHENLRTAKSMLGKVLFVNPLNCTQVADLPSWAGCSCKSMQFSFSLVFACVCMLEVAGDSCVCVCMCICVCIFPVSQCFGFHNWKLAKRKQKANSCIWSESMLNSVRLEQKMLFADAQIILLPWVSIHQFFEQMWQIFTVFYSVMHTGTFRTYWGSTMMVLDDYSMVL